jgi:hypothetical protein
MKHAAAMALGISLLGTVVGAQAPPALDFATYRTQVEPIFLKPRDAYGPGGSCFVCHTHITSRLKLQPLPASAKAWSEPQSRQNFAAVMRLVVPGDPLKSRLLLHPLAADAGGDPAHLGGKHWSSQNDLEWQALAAWVRSAPATPAAAVRTLDFEVFRTRVQPIFLKKRESLARCYTCHGQGTGFRLQTLSPGSTSWTEEESRKNFEAVQRLVVPGDPLSSRLLMVPLATEAGGDPFHPGGKHWLSQKDPEWQVLAAWIRGHG